MKEMSLKKTAMYVIAIIFSVLMMLSPLATFPKEANAHVNTCTHGSTWHYGSSTYYYHQINFRSHYSSGGYHYHTYRIYYYTWYSGYGWYLTDYTTSTRRC